MKFIRKKIIKGREYYYFEFWYRINGQRRTVTRFIGKELPEDMRPYLKERFAELPTMTEKFCDPKEKAFFAPKSVLPIEQARFWYQGFHHELFENDLRLFRSLFGVLFLLNSNRAEGSRVTRKDIEKLVERERKPRTLTDFEVVDSLQALRFAFSRKTKWNFSTFKRLHFILFQHLSPTIAGKWKLENNTVSNEPTTEWQNVKKELKTLMEWFWAERKTGYPPRVALEFLVRFEAIHPFEDGNGRIGRLLFNAYLLQSGFMPVIFFSENHTAHCAALSAARQGRKQKLAHYFIEQVTKTMHAVEQYKKEGILRGGSPRIGQWEIEKGKIRKF
jgi:fido (protein-threonine AMPylation protein)